MEAADQVFETNISIGNDLYRSEDQFYSSAIHLTDEAILSLKTAMEENRLKEDQFYFLSYLLSRPALSLKDVTVICLSLFTDGLSTTTPTILFNLYCLATWPEVQQRVFNEIAEQVKKTKTIRTFFQKMVCQVADGELITSETLARFASTLSVYSSRQTQLTFIW